MADPASSSEITQPDDHSQFYWFRKNLKGKMSRFIRQHWFLFSTGIGMSLFLLFMLRAFIHPAVIWIRIHILLIAAVVGLLYVLRQLLFRGHWRRRLTWAALSVIVVPAAVYKGDEMHQYLSLYFRYATLRKLELTTLPTTGFERIQPLNSIHSLAHEAMGEQETPMIPDFVRVDKGFRFTLGVEPAYPIPRFDEGVSRILSVSGTAPAPNFSHENRISVSFEVGENLLFGRKSMIATVRSFGPWRYLTYQPAEVTYVPDDTGEWVQVVSLIRWTGFIFPRPEFGGVQVIRQNKVTLLSSLKLMFVGAGEWVRPVDIPNHPYLAGQNILSYTVSRYIANSFRYQDGFLAAFPGYHKGDVRIPDLPEDVNDQPFTVNFHIPGRGVMDLYQYFALEPFDPDKQGLNTSLLIPADGTPVVYFYHHYRKGEILTGVSAIAPKVMESRKYYDWTQHRPVEHLPFIRDCDGERRFFWKTTVITHKDKPHESKRYIAGSMPDVVITDPQYNASVWVDAQSPDSWIPQIERELARVWAKR